MRGKPKILCVKGGKIKINDQGREVRSEFYNLKNFRFRRITYKKWILKVGKSAEVHGADTF